MRKGKIVPLAFMGIFLCTCALAQTLDEVLHPLLKKGQWNLALGYKNYGHEYFSIDLDYGKMTYFDSQIVLFPQLTFGLAKNLQLTFDGAYQFPITFSAPQFDEWDYWRETDTIRSLSTQLLFRPAPNMELSLFFLQGRAKNDVYFPRTLGIDTHYMKNFTGTILILGGTWLSIVDNENSLIGADLEGLYGPLLNKGHWRIEPEIMVRSHEYEYRHRYDALPDYIDKNIDSIDTRLRLAASHGLTDHVEVTADGYWQPSFLINEFSRSSIWWDETEHYQEGETSQLYFDNWGARGSFLWRPSPQLELNLAISRIGLKTGYGESENQAGTPAAKEVVIISRVWYTHIISQIDLAATWLSKPKRPGVPLVADLAGIYHPLLEKKQFKLDGKIYFRSYRIPNEPYEDFLKGLNNSDFWLFRLQSAYGMFHSLQVSVYYGVSLSKHLFTGFKYEKEYSLGGELKWRFKKRAEIYAAFNYRPWTFLDNFPPFLLSINDYSSQHHDFLSRNFGEAINIELGFRFVF